MAAIEQEIFEQIQKLDLERKKQVLEYVRRLNRPTPSEHGSEAQPSWSDDEIRELLTSKRKTPKEVGEWLDANPPTEEWGGMSPEDDPAEFIHNLRRQTRFELEDPEEDA